MSVERGNRAEFRVEQEAGLPPTDRRRLFQLRPSTDMMDMQPDPDSDGSSQVACVVCRSPRRMRSSRLFPTSEGSGDSGLSKARLGGIRSDCCSTRVFDSDSKASGRCRSCATLVARISASSPSAPQSQNALTLVNLSVGRCAGRISSVAESPLYE